MILLLAFAWFAFPTLWEPRAVGGPDDTATPSVYARAVDELTRKEEVLREHLESLQEESRDLQRQVRRLTEDRRLAAARGDAARVRSLDREIAGVLRSDTEVTEARGVLERLRRDREAFDAFVRASATQVVQSQVAVIHPVLTEEVVEIPGVDLLRWPVTPLRGLSATFRDEGYRRRFGMHHDAIDIPVPQGTPFRSPRNGVVVRAVDNAYGYSYVEVQHGRNLTTRYGHVSEILVEEGRFVRRGEILGLTGGRPGSHGAGFLTTGPHLHFEVITSGRHVDPLVYLPRREFLASSSGD